MSAPRIIAQVVILGSQIVGKAFVAAWKQTVANASAREAVGGATGSSAGGDAITRRHRMSLDEACNILNVKSIKYGDDSSVSQMLKNYEHLFKQNDPKAGSSFYLQSKIVRAKQRIEGELMAERERLKQTMDEPTPPPPNAPPN
ncbi:uncharacterized protein L969DRAFT_64417 [Mixia osmundae IAM 14324]|uniref:Mitochondrial import inner membrane translocase subunit TIM16 n=1 Tax=Mixia osmundae (strain CBS 9802 / IAM 14324 / JCM 22182 / KY 12970) TaxID=764103 RepID=G7E839_MIXOS|nr:uncharacterized protein L969DRAFT_64417 [Mixia osmundae IAM 14324]KEI38599.1 hypothetical protein L969DRAFT_64417 [Mixia osmundae IAM 14324]GAA98999.1 hypothetical protein E5Q_05688 [Mixia osmundae IAM 14324]